MSSATDDAVELEVDAECIHIQENSQNGSAQFWTKFLITQKPSWRFVTPTRNEGVKQWVNRCWNLATVDETLNGQLRSLRYRYNGLLRFWFTQLSL